MTTQLAPSTSFKVLPDDTPEHHIVEVFYIPLGVPVLASEKTLCGQPVPPDWDFRPNPKARGICPNCLQLHNGRPLRRN